MPDRIKFAISAAYIKENIPNAVHALNNNRYKYKSDEVRLPYFSYQKETDSVIIDINVPKVLYGNSLWESKDSCLNCLVYLCELEALKKGLQINPQIIKNAKATYWEFSKNLIFPIKHSMNASLDRLHKSFLGKSPDLSKTFYLSRKVNKKRAQLYNIYGRTGQKVGFRTDSYEVCFYDKTGEVMQSPRKEDKKAFVKLTKQEQQAMRYEVRYSKHKDIKAALKSVDPSNPCTLEALFNRDLEQRVLWNYWDQVQVNMPKARLSKRVLEAQIDAATKKGCSSNDIVWLVGYDYISSTLGMAKFYELTAPSFLGLATTQKTSRKSSIKKNHKKLKGMFNYKKMFLASIITEQLTAFKPIWVDANGNIQGGY